MKRIHRLVITTIAAPFTLPIAASAAKAERKKAGEPLPAYQTIDPDSKGGVSKDPFVAGLKERLGSEDTAEAKFGTLNQDRDGDLTKDEYAAGIE